MKIQPKNIEDCVISVEEARELLGEVANNMSDSEVMDKISLTQQLVEWFMDEFERKTFGKTLNELEVGP